MNIEKKILKVKTTSQNTDFQLLVNQLDRYLSGVNGDADDFFKQFNQIDLLHYVIVVYEKDLPIGCGAIKQFDDKTMEIKRMYVLPEARGKGIAQGILSALEIWASALGFEKCILETNKTMLDAIGLYQKCNYAVIPNYGQYADVETSICFEKNLPNTNIDNQSDYWDSVAESKTFTHPMDVDFLAEFVAKNASILDFGCGYGRIVSILTKEKYQNIEGFDTSKALIERGLKVGNLPLFHIETPFDLPIADDSIDCILLFAVLTCIPSNQGQRDLIRLLRSKLKPNGVLYISDYFLQEDLSEVSRYTYWQGDKANFGVFTLHEGVTFRHHPPEWIDLLFENFHKEKMQEIAVKTMNGHEAKGFQMMWRK